MRTDLSPSGDHEDIPLSPMIDAVFLLLIFFLVSTMMKKQDRDIDIRPPESVSADRLAPTDNNRVIGIDPEGALYYEGEPATLQSLHTTIRELGRQAPDVQIRLDVDRDTPTHRVIEVLDLCRFNHLLHVGIRTYDEFYNRP
ncbi:MAG: biopolymer transporter ExbD [Kiritimatiellae bacterium]|nr:biopolymer transporter ExbD [Kiritimatiellia bacterium]